MVFNSEMLEFYVNRINILFGPCEIECNNTSQIKFYNKGNACVSVFDVNNKTAWTDISKIINTKKEIVLKTQNEIANRFGDLGNQ